MAAETAVLVWRPDTSINFLLDDLLDSKAETDRCIALASRAAMLANCETKTLLRARAVDDPHELARRTALEQLAQRFGEDAETKTLLRARAVDDPQPGPRRTALAMLAQRFGEDAETKTLLRARAVDDPHELARRTALAMLAQRFGEAGNL